MFALDPFRANGSNRILRRLGRVQSAREPLALGTADEQKIFSTVRRPGIEYLPIDAVVMDDAPLREIVVEIRG